VSGDTRHHFKIRIPGESYCWPYQMAAVEPLPDDMEVMAWWEGEWNQPGAVVYEGSHGASPESLATVHRLMETARER
jgi:hypothetical protein